MGRVWVLDTETKGTGAQMVPLDRVLKKLAPEPLVVAPKPKPRPPNEPEPRQPRRFRVVDVATREVLADGAGAWATLGVLKDVRSSVDVHVYVWEPGDDVWRLLSFAEQRILRDRRERG
jgi:hypothetical protein